MPWLKCLLNAALWSQAKCWNWARLRRILHRRAGLHVSRKGIDIVIGVRGHAKQMVEAAPARE